VSEVGKALAVKDVRLIGCSLPNSQGSWSDQVKAKMKNVDQSLRKYKFGYMDQINRDRMHTLLSQGQVQRNFGQHIGVRVQQVQIAQPRMPEQRERASRPTDDEFVPDWSPVSAESDVSLQEGGAGVTAPLGPEERSPSEESAIMLVVAQVPRTPERFCVSTFGVQTLASVLHNRNAAANAMLDLWTPTRGGAPQPIPNELVEQALMDCGLPKPSVSVDARFFRPPRSQHTRWHIGHSRSILEDVMSRPEWTEWWKSIFTQAVTSNTGGVTPVHVTVFCRAGEKRSVGIAWLVSECLKLHGWREERETEHLCRRLWDRRTCAGNHCAECDTNSPQHKELVRRAYLAVLTPPDL
jgi:hypothetical protein